MPSFLPTITDLRDPALTQALRAALDNKTKPLGSLGRLEALALQLGEILGNQSPVLAQPQMVVFAGDHGITAQGVSAFPSEVSWQMLENFLAGGAAVSVLARQHGLALTVVDCGVKHDFLAGLPAGSQRPGLQVRKADGAHLGTADSSQQPAMRPAQCAQALRHGVALVQGLPGNALLLGETVPERVGATEGAASAGRARLACECGGGGGGLCSADGAGISWRKNSSSAASSANARPLRVVRCMVSAGSPARARHARRFWHSQHQQRLPPL
jgi:nicotinate-nucleotide--dimethylbenzimidazole phosphoribosyltransferase